MATVQGIYLALFGRPADPAGLTYFNKITNDGKDLAAISNLAGQPEYLSRFSGMSNAQIVNSIYLSLFGREAEKAGLDFFVGQLESGKLTINTIALNILDGAAGNDKQVVETKLAAASLFTSHLDLAVEVQAYSGNTAATIVRNFISTINTNHPATPEEVDAIIQSLLTSGGQSPGGGSDNGSVDPPTPTPFSVTVDAAGTLTFSGGSFPTNKSIAVDVIQGKLVFSQSGASATLSDEQHFSGLQEGVQLTHVEGSQVIAYDDEAASWTFVGTGSIDAADFYEAVGTASNVLLLDGFSIHDLGKLEMVETNDEVPTSDGLGDLLGFLDNAATFLSSTTNVAVVASTNANTSLNEALVNLILGASPPGGDTGFPSLQEIKELAAQLPNVGLPILLKGEGANDLSATGEKGFTLVGNWDRLKEGLSQLLSFSEGSQTQSQTSDEYPSFEKITGGSNDTLTGGKGGDIFLGLGDDGSWSLIRPEKVAAFEAIEEPPVLPIKFTGGDILTGGGGNDLFIHVEFKDYYSDNLDIITNFNEQDVVLVVGDKYINKVTIAYDNDGVANDTFFYFSDCAESSIYSKDVDTSAGIVIRNNTDVDVIISGPIAIIGMTTEGGLPSWLSSDLPPR